MHFDPTGLTRLDVYFEGRPAGVATPFVIGRHVAKPSWERSSELAPLGGVALKVHAERDHGYYPTGVKITPAQLAAVPLTGNRFHPEWNYTIGPARRTPPCNYA